MKLRRGIAFLLVTMATLCGRSVAGNGDVSTETYYIERARLEVRFHLPEARARRWRINLSDLDMAGSSIFYKTSEGAEYVSIFFNQKMNSLSGVEITYQICSEDFNELILFSSVDDIERRKKEYLTEIGKFDLPNTCAECAH